MEIHIHAHLIEQCRKNDKKAQMELYDAYSKAMFNTAFNFVKDDQQAMDLMQEGFIKAFRKLDTYNGDASFGSWLKRIVVNQCLDWMKKKRIETEEIDQHSYHLTEDKQLEIDDSIEIKKIYQCIEDLPTKCKNVVKLYLLEGYDHEEVAQILNISEVSSRSQLSRGKQRLRELLIQHSYES